MSNTVAEAITKNMVEEAVRNGNYILAVRALHAYLYQDDDQSKEFSLGIFRAHGEDIAEELEKDDFLLAAESVREMNP